ncbi:MAG: hypothetical protein U5O39_12565 [Gammaproteobacteria bacterium]|nr:hypothetical protein [Gammaproteobacteria bacterium]
MNAIAIAATRIEPDVPRRELLHPQDLRNELQRHQHLADGEAGEQESVIPITERSKRGDGHETSQPEDMRDCSCFPKEPSLLFKLNCESFAFTL